MIKEEGIVIGIDIGTTTTSAAVFKNGVSDILKMGNGDLMIQSVVTYNHSSKAVGYVPKGKKQSMATVYEVKRILGTKYKDAREEIERNNWSYKVFEGNDGMSTIELSIASKGETSTKFLSPVDVYADILSYIREFAQKFVGMDNFSSCVVTCPVDFSLCQRRAVLSACMLADLTNVSLISEPTAAAIAFADKFEKDNKDVRHYLVYDFGGGTFDASVVRRKGDQYTVIKTKGDAHLGGKDIDVALIKKAKEFMELGGKRLSPRETLKLKIACKEAKEHLLTIPSIDISSEYDDETEASCTLTQTSLDNVALPIVQKTITVVRETLAACDPPLTPEDIDLVFLMGGSSCLLAVKSEIENLFPNKICVDTKELSRVGIALGAALVANCKQLRSGANLLPIQLRDVSSYSVRVLCGEITRVVVPAQTPLREEHSLRLIPMEREKKFVRVVITVGESEQREENQVLGVLKVPISRTRRPEEQPLLVSVRVEEDDKVDVTVRNELSNRCFHAVLQAGLDSELLAQMEIEKKKREEEEIEFRRMDAIRQDIFDKCSGKLDGLNAESVKQIQQINIDVTSNKYSVEELERIRQRLISLLYSSRVCFQ